MYEKINTDSRCKILTVSKCITCKENTDVGYDRY